MSTSDKSSSRSAEPEAAFATTPLDFVKQLWGGMQVPGMSTPSFSADDINKQIADLKTVESWLTLNMSLLRGTIQALEVQAATIAALQTMYQSMQTASQAAASGQAPDAASAASSGAPFSSPFASQFATLLQPPFGFSPAPSTPSAAQATAGSSKPSAAGGGGANAHNFSNPGNAPVETPFGNPAAWWNLLQNQFKQTVDAALSPQAASEADMNKAGVKAAADTAGSGKSNGGKVPPKAKARVKAKVSAKPKPRST